MLLLVASLAAAAPTFVVIEAADARLVGRTCTVAVEAAGALPAGEGRLSRPVEATCEGLGAVRIEGATVRATDPDAAKRAAIAAPIGDRSSAPRGTDALLAEPSPEVVAELDALAATPSSVTPATATSVAGFNPNAAPAPRATVRVVTPADPATATRLHARLGGVTRRLDACYAPVAATWSGTATVRLTLPVTGVASDISVSEAGTPFPSRGFAECVADAFRVVRDGAVAAETRAELGVTFAVR